jgi:hypothetical protein
MALHSACGICGVIGEVVRDHDHKTGFVRGLLCRQCNSWLGVFESNKTKIRQKGRRQYLEWARRFANEIEKYLSDAAGVVAQGLGIPHKGSMEYFRRYFGQPKSE